MKKLVTAFAGIVLISGCAAQYKEPENGQLAKLEFVNNTEYEMYPETYNGAQECTNRTHIGKIPENGRKTINISAQNPIAFTAITSGGARDVMLAMGGALAAVATDGFYKDCSPSIRFTPKTGAVYTLYMNSKNGECEYRFTEKVGTNESILSANSGFEPMVWKRAFGESGPWCEQISK